MSHSRNWIAAGISVFMAAGCLSPDTSVLSPSDKKSDIGAPGTPMAQGSAQIVKVLSLNFNSETASKDYGFYLRDKRFPRIIDFIKKNDIDIVLFSEGWNYRDAPSIAQSVAAALDYDVAYRLTLGAPGLLFDSDGVIAKKKFHMTDERDVKLAHSGANLGDGKNWIVSLGSQSWGVGAKLRLENGEPLYAYATHLVGDTEQDRLDQALSLNEAIRQQVIENGGDWDTAKVIYGGDFNSDTGSAPDRYLRLDHYLDSWDLAHPGDPGSSDCADPKSPYFNPMGITDLFPAQNNISNAVCGRPDHVYVKGTGQQTLASQLVFLAPYQGVWMSDHFGVVSTFAMNGVAPQNYPNPRDDLTEMPPTTQLDILPKYFDCPPFQGEGQVCEHPLGAQDVHGPRGVTLRNIPGSGDVHIQIDDSAGHVITVRDTWLADGGIMSFVFTANGRYPYQLTDNLGNFAYGEFNVTGL